MIEGKGYQMPVWLDIIAIWAFIGLACYARGLYLELKSTKQRLEKSQEMVKLLIRELSEARKRIDKLMPY